ncbi:MAG: outer membrane lipoprotein carrier protein LolA [Opitutaceae bacterium]
MRSLSVFLLLVSCLVLPAFSAAPAEVPPANLIADPVNDPGWKELFARLAPQQARRSQFEERRIFPFRTTPIVLTGEIRISPDRGLSLNYLGAKPQIVIIDQKGVLMRDERGQQRTAPADPRADAATSALFHILRFDLPALAKTFILHGRRDGEAWTLGFEPRDATLSGLIGSVIVQGEGGRVDRINMVKSEKQRIDILISDTKETASFDEEELKRFFR